MIDRSLKQNKWTLMKYVKDFDLITLYADAVRKGNANVSNDALLKMHERMAAEGIYKPRFKKLSLPTIQFKVCQIVYYMFAYKMKVNSRSVNKLVFSPLGNLLLDNIKNREIVSKTFFCMLYAMPFKHPFNKMRPDFDLYPYRLIFKLLLDDRIERRLYHDEVFYLVMYTKHIDDDEYEKLIKSILELRKMSYDDKYKLFTQSVDIEDTLANALHEWNFACGTLSGAGILDWDKTNESYGTLIHGKDRSGKQSGRRSYKKDSVQIRPELMSFAQKMINSYEFDEKPSAILSEVSLPSEYIIQLYNFYPPELLQELNISSEIQESIVNILKITENIKVFSRNVNEGDAYRFEDILCDAFNYFVDIEAEKQAIAGTTDIGCIYLPENKKFDVEAKSTKNKLMTISAGRLKHHRIKIGSKYTVVITPYFAPAVLDDIKDTDTVIVRAASFSNYLYQAVSKHKNDIRYAPIDRIIEVNLGKDITPLINQYVYDHYGVGVS